MCIRDSLIAHEGILIVYLLIGIHLAIIGQGGYTVTGQFLGEFTGCLLYTSLGYMLLGDERLDDADGILHLIFREQG